jgi:small subunit ribosomal protein S1
VNVLILEIDGERRRLSLSLKRVEEDAVPVPRADGGESVHSMPDLRLSEEAFPASAAVAQPEDEAVEAGAAEGDDEASAVPADETAEGASAEAETVAEATDATADEPEALEPEAVESEAAEPEADGDQPDEHV